jgi:hypothetical protein
MILGHQGRIGHIAVGPWGNPRLGQERRNV